MAGDINSLLKSSGHGHDAVVGYPLHGKNCLFGQPGRLQRALVTCTCNAGEKLSVGDAAGPIDMGPPACHTPLAARYHAGSAVGANQRREVELSALSSPWISSGLWI